nr:PREDICTED: uncharacterized protein LOC105663479 [Megachile rotundata]
MSDNCNRLMQLLRLAERDHDTFHGFINEIPLGKPRLSSLEVTTFAGRRQIEERMLKSVHSKFIRSSVEEINLVGQKKETKWVLPGNKQKFVSPSHGCFSKSVFFYASLWNCHVVTSELKKPFDRGDGSLPDDV